MNVLRTDNGWTVWLSMTEEPPTSGWVWLWGPQLGMTCWLVSDESPPDGAWMWATCRPPEAPANIHTFVMHAFAAELDGREVPGAVASAVALLGWEDDLKDGVDEMRRVLAKKEGS